MLGISRRTGLLGGAMTAVTREDREAAVLLYRMNDLAAPDDPTDLAAYAEWAADPERATHVSRGERKRLDRYASHLAAHREASTRALREAAEAVIAAADKHAPVSTWSKLLSGAIDALRSALSASPAQGGAAVPAVADSEVTATLSVEEVGQSLDGKRVEVVLAGPRAEVMKFCDYLLQTVAVTVREAAR